MVDGRGLLAAARHGSLATLLADGTPYASLVACAVLDGEPLFLLSELAEHTKNLRRDARASLLVVDGGDGGEGGEGGDPLARGRATFVGRCVETGDAEARRVYVATHPEAERYLAMKDFRLWRLQIAAVRTIAGFGVMTWERRGQGV